MRDYDDWRTSPPEDVSDKAYESAMADLTSDLSAVDIFDVPGVDNLVGEALNNKVIAHIAAKGIVSSKDDDDDNSVEALIEVLETMTGAAVMTLPGVDAAVRDYYSGEAVTRAERAERNRPHNRKRGLEED